MGQGNTAHKFQGGGEWQTSSFLFLFSQFAIKCQSPKEKQTLSLLQKDCILRRVPEVELLGLNFKIFL